MEFDDKRKAVDGLIICKESNQRPCQSGVENLNILA